MLISVTITVQFCCRFCFIFIFFIAFFIPSVHRYKIAVLIINGHSSCAMWKQFIHKYGTAYGTLESVPFLFDWENGIIRRDAGCSLVRKELKIECNILWIRIPPRKLNLETIPREQKLNRQQWNLEQLCHVNYSVTEEENKTHEWLSLNSSCVVHWVTLAWPDLEQELWITPMGRCWEAK